MHGCGATMEIYRGHDAGAALSQLCLPAEKCCGMPYCEEFAVHSTQVEQGKQAKQASRLPRRTDCPSKCRTILAVLCCRSVPASLQQTNTSWTPSNSLVLKFFLSLTRPTRSIVLLNIMCPPLQHALQSSRVSRCFFARQRRMLCPPCPSNTLT